MAHCQAPVVAVFRDRKSQMQPCARAHFFATVHRSVTTPGCIRATAVLFGLCKLGPSNQMKMRAVMLAVSMAALAGACVPREQVSFNAGPQQQAIMRDGQQSIVSRKKGSTVIVRLASRGVARGGRPVFVMAIQNNGKTPSDFRVATVSAVQLQNGASLRAIPVVPYEKLVSEEQTRQVVAALVVGVAAAGNSINAQNASYYGNGRYSPIAGALNGARADAQNAAMVEDTVAQGQVNMVALEKNVLKDNTVMPSEWVGGQLHLEPPQSEGQGIKTYVISVPVGDDIHEITVSQGGAA